MVGVIYVYIDTIFGFYNFLFVCCFLELLSWMFWHACLGTCCFECLICIHFVFLYLPLFSAIEHVSHEKVL